MRTLTLLLSFTLVLAACRQREQAVATSGTTQPAKKTAAPAQTATGTDVGAAMPEYSAMWLDGSKFDLASKRDKVVLLNVWATWCGPCREEIPVLQSLHDKFQSKGFDVVGVSVDEGDIESVKQFVTEQKVTYPIVLDPQGKIANLLQISVLPSSVLLDRHGTIVWKHYQAIPPNDTAGIAELTQAIEKAL